MSDITKRDDLMTVEEMKIRKKELGLSVRRLSELSGVPVGTLQKVFNGESKMPRYDTRMAIQKVLKATPRQGEYSLVDYYSISDDRRVELIDGVIYDQAAPTPVHQLICGKMYFAITNFINGRKGKCIPFISPIDVRLDADDKTMVQPDVVILCDRSKLKRWGIMGAPDFVLEVISPGNGKNDYALKVHKYCQAGVREYWIIDPIKKILVTYDFSKDQGVANFHYLNGKCPMALYDGELEIDLDEIASLIDDYTVETSTCAFL